MGKTKHVLKLVTSSDLLNPGEQEESEARGGVGGHQGIT